MKDQILRIKLTLEYDGTLFHGWQHQNGLSTIEGEVLAALEILFKFRFDLQVCGRTDAGVHALGQVCHFDLSYEQYISFLSRSKNLNDSDYEKFFCYKLTMALNNLLYKKRISIIHSFVAGDTSSNTSQFHARFSAIEKIYIYKIINRPALLTFQTGYFWHIIKKLDIDSMSVAANYLIGNHDFSSFRSVQCGANKTNRTMDEIRIENKNDSEIWITLRARSFLHNMCRIIVGTLVNFGHKLSRFNSSELILKILEAKDRRAAGPTAPACGLYLAECLYE